MSHVRNLLNRHSAQEHIKAPDPGPTLSIPVVMAKEAATLPPEFALAEPQHPIARIEEADLSSESKLVFHHTPNGPAADRFRLLRMRLKEHWGTGHLKKLLVTGPLAGEGKSTIILNLATALAERGKRKVLVMEADFHHASLGRRLSLKPGPGLLECLVDKTLSPHSTIRRISQLDWYFMPAGGPRKDPTELIQTPALGHLIHSITPDFDWILIDSPPVVPLTDAVALQQHTDGTLLVVRADRTPKEAVEQTIALLGKQNIVGVVLNGVKAQGHLYSRYDRTTHHIDHTED